MGDHDVLEPASAETVAELRDHRAEITALAVSRFGPIETTGRMSSANRSKMIVDGIEMTGRMLESLVATGSTPLVDDQVAWSARHLPNEGLPLASLVKGLQVYRDAVVATLSDRASREVVPYIDRMIRMVERFGAGSEEGAP